LCTDVEEVLVRVFTGRVVRVHIELFLLVKWLLNIPEHVGRDGSEYLHGCGCLESLTKSVLEILNIVVLLTLFEHRKLLVEVCIPLIKWQVVRLDLFHKSDAKFFCVFLCLFNRGLALRTLELGSQASFVKPVSQLLVLDLVN
jgi:hypothetical protein